MLAGAFIAYSINYLIIEPVYTCVKPGLTERSQCTKEVICLSIPGEVNPAVRHQIDWSDRKSLHNWIGQYSLQCVAEGQLG